MSLRSLFLLTTSLCVHMADKVASDRPKIPDLPKPGFCKKLSVFFTMVAHIAALVFTGYIVFLAMPGNCKYLFWVWYSKLKKMRSDISTHSQNRCNFYGKIMKLNDM